MNSRSDKNALERQEAMNRVESIELLFGVELVAVFAQNDAYGEMIRDIREKYKKQGIDFPIVNLRDNMRLTGKQYQVLINKEIVFDGEIKDITEKTMEEMITQVRDSFFDYYNQHLDV